VRGGALSRSLGPGAPAQRRASRVLPRAAGASPGDRRGAWKETETRSTAAAHKPRSGHRPLPTASRRRGEVALGVTLRRGPRARSGMDVKMQIKGVRGRGRTESVPGANRPTAPRAACRPEDLRRSVLGGVLEASVCPPCLPVLPSPYCFL